MLQFIKIYKYYILAFFFGFVTAKYMFDVNVERFVVNVSDDGPSISLDELDLLTIIEITFNIETKLTKSNVINLLKMFRNMIMSKKIYTNDINPKLEKYFKVDEDQMKRISYFYDMNKKFKKILDKYIDEIEKIGVADEYKHKQMRILFMNDVFYKRKSLKDLHAMVRYFGIVGTSRDLQHILNTTNFLKTINRENTVTEVSSAPIQDDNMNSDDMSDTESVIPNDNDINMTPNMSNKTKSSVVIPSVDESISTSNDINMTPNMSNNTENTSYDVKRPRRGTPIISPFIKKSKIETEL